MSGVRTGKVPGNDASKAETRVDGGWGGSFVQESSKVSVESANHWHSQGQGDRSPEKSFFLDFTCACTSIPTTTCQPGHLESPLESPARVE